MTIDELIVSAYKYLEKNPERFTSQEKVKFLEDLKEWINGKSNVIADEVYDFLMEFHGAEQKKRHIQYASYLNKKYGSLKFRRILDVGAGRMCRLSETLAKYGAKMYAIDPNIRLSENEAYDKRITAISKKHFECDEFATKGKKGTYVQPYDMIIGLEPCDATEHIIRQGMKYDKLFNILLCAAPHDALNGRKFERYEDWYEYLASISTEVEITKVNEDYYASNDPQNSNILGM